MIIQAFNAVTGIASFVLAIDLLFCLWYTRNARLLLVSFVPSDKRPALLSLFAALWGVPIMMMLGSFKLFVYAVSYSSVLSTVLTGMTCAIALTVATLTSLYLVKLLKHGK